ncbi:uncharacterized protein BJ212DRAFT_1483137 [Suillus subaureus]|uniref:Uncharacterized protein n=1 Tax=Suillus subaureus TaxID=48587 RepID=A0A9P7E692_9AGAM|nr:uncharacterized protein BJ212DRAFT_1483137 [Suillus subaureus]KAG1812523.1 hypothetical protein BJ212DRAFT_1483137 [Suillus subaureus]
MDIHVQPPLSRTHTQSHSFCPPLRLLLSLILNRSQFRMLRVARRLFHPTITRSSFTSQYIMMRLEIISINNLQVPLKSIPAGIYITINIGSRRRWKSAIKVLSSNKSVAWGDTVTLSSHTSPAFSVEIGASYEVDQMLGSGEVIRKLQTSWDELLDQGNQIFDLSFPPVRGVHPSLTLKTAVLHACDDEGGPLSGSLVDCEISRNTDAGRARLAKYVIRKRVSHLNHAVQHFRLVLDQLPVNHPDHADVLTNLAYTRLQAYIYIQDIDTITSLFREALALRPQGHPDHAPSLYHLITALNWHDRKDSTTAVSLHEEALRLRSVGHKSRSFSSGNLGTALVTCFNEHGDIDVIARAIDLFREALVLRLFGHPRRDTTRNNLASALTTAYGNSHVSEDLNGVVDRYCESLQSSATITNRAAADRAATEHRRLMKQWEAAAEIRHLQAFSRFLLPAVVCKPASGSASRPSYHLHRESIVVQCHYFTISGKPHHVPLSSITPADLKILKDRFTRAIQHASRMNPGESRMDLIVLSRIIWNEIMLPIVNVLKHVLKLKRRSRIWLCPTAAFTSIPLHAAKPFKQRQIALGRA